MLKKHTPALGALLITLSSAPAAADILKIEAGIDYLNMDTDGILAAVDAPVFTDSSSSNYSIFAAVEHPIPVLPNALVRYNQFEALDASYEILGQTFGQEIDTSSVDLTLYYELLSNSLISLDLGTAVRKYLGDIDTWNAMGYAHAEIGLPLANLSLFGDALIPFDGDKDAKDFSVGFLTTSEFYAVDFKIRGGWRSATVESLGLDIEQSGWFLGASLDFL